MLLHKIRKGFFYPRFIEYFIWLAFMAIVLVSTNSVASIDKIRAYNFDFFNVALTFGLITSCYLVEAAVAAVFFVILEFLAEKALKIQLRILLRAVLFTGLILTLVLLFLSIFIL